MSELREYVGPDGVSTFGRWFNVLDGVAAAKIAIVLARLGEGNTSHLKGVGGGVAELRVHFGPGYRIYLGVDGHTKGAARLANLQVDEEASTGMTHATHA